ncbi:Der GTPase-activating protein YihI [Colwelliaceae bacterium 6471]
MSRKKKSRKPGVGSSGIVKDEKKKVAVVVDKKPKKSTGKKAGNRQQEATKKQSTQTNNVTNKDPRLGSKKPIVLIKESTKVEKKPIKHKVEPIAAIRTIEPDNALEDELYAIEQDELLQVILEKQEQDIALSEQEVNHFNKLMDRHQQIREALGWDNDDSEAPDESKQKPSSEDELWNKFDNGDLSDYH